MFDPKARGDYLAFFVFSLRISKLNLLNQTIKIMYTLDCPYYDREFNSIDELLFDILLTGMDPNYEILLNGEKTGESAIDLIIE